MVEHDADSSSLRLIAKVSEMPFASHFELADCLGMAADNVQRNLREMLSDGVVGHVPHVEGKGVRTRRWCLTRLGVLQMCRPSWLHHRQAAS